MQSPSQSASDPLARLRNRVRSGEAVVAGVLSGTSADGIDVALTRFEPSETDGPGRPICQAFRTIAFQSDLRERLRRVLDGTPPSLAELARLDRDLGRAFGAAARELAQESGLELDLVASHGQTIWHHDGSPGGAATLQVGDGCEVAEAAGVSAVSDFRTRDIAAGGEGAPLLALVEAELFPAHPRPLAVLNLGGISNLTWLTEEPSCVLTLDTGPAGSLLDGFSRRLLDRPFDVSGAVAAQGDSSEELVRAWGAHPFFATKPPRSTGRDTFGEEWVDRLLEEGPKNWRPEDALRTAVEFVAECVARSLRDFVAGAAGAPMAVAGGGVHNAALMRALKERCTTRVESSAHFGVDPDSREAVAFAVLGARQVLGWPSTIPGCTGAAGGRVLGKLSLIAKLG